MENIVGYIVLLVVGLALLYAYQSRRLKVRQLPLSVQNYGDCELKLFIQKQHRKTSAIVLRVAAKKEFVLKNICVELINNKREFENIDLRYLTDIKNWPVTLPSNQYLDVKIAFYEFKSAISDHEFLYKTFRLVAETSLNKKYKTHELGFNKNWVIFKPDSGRYN